MWLVNYRLDFTTSIKIFFSIESFFRTFHCGCSQPLKLAIFLRGWQPAWMVHFIKLVGDTVNGFNAVDTGTKEANENGISKELICSVAVHLDMAALFGTALFIVMNNLAR